MEIVRERKKKRQREEGGGRRRERERSVCQEVHNSDVTSRALTLMELYV